MGAGASTENAELATAFGSKPEEHAKHAASGRWGVLEAVLAAAKLAKLAAARNGAVDDARFAEAQESKAAREVIAKHVSRDCGLDPSVEPPAELLAALCEINCPLPCELHGPCAVGSYHRNCDGDLRSFSTAEARTRWFERELEKMPLPSAEGGSWSAIDPTVHDADFALQYGSEGRDGATLPALVAKCAATRAEHEKVYKEVVAAAAAAEPEAFEALSLVKSTANEKLRQPESACSSVLALYRGALLVLPSLWAVGVDVAHGRAKSMTWSVKKPERFFKKALQKYDNDAGLVTDVARISIVFETVADVLAAVTRLCNPYRAVVFKNRFVDVADGGYCDVLSQIELPGQICEVQLHLATVFDLKSEAGHKCYKWFRRFADVGYTGPADEQGQPHGEKGCRDVMANGDRYEGAFVHGQQVGRGRYVFADGDVMEGEFAEGGICVGTYLAANGSQFEGRIEGNRWQGEGVYTTPDGSMRRGTFECNQLVKGTWTYGSKRRNSTALDTVIAGANAAKEKTAAGASRMPPPGTVFEGEFVPGTDQLHGQGKMTYPDGRYLAGEFANGALCGEGTIRLVRSDGKPCEKTGTFHKNVLTAGKFVNGDEVVEGAFEAKAGKPHGQCVATMKDGMVIDGEFKLGKPWNAAVKAPGGSKVIAKFEDGKQVQVPA